MSSARDSIFGACASRRLRRPTVSLARLLLLLCFAVHTLGQTFQYSRGWTNGRKRAFAPPIEAHREASSLPSVEDLSDEDLKQRALAEGNRIEQGRLEALFLVLGNNEREAAGEDGDELDMMKQKAGGGKRKGGWRRNSLSENFLRRRRRRMVGQQEGGVSTFN